MGPQKTRALARKRKGELKKGYLPGKMAKGFGMAMGNFSSFEQNLCSSRLQSEKNKGLGVDEGQNIPGEKPKQPNPSHPFGPPKCMVTLVRNGEKKFSGLEGQKRGKLYRLIWIMTKICGVYFAPLLLYLNFSNEYFRFFPRGFLEQQNFI